MKTLAVDSHSSIESTAVPGQVAETLMDSPQVPDKLMLALRDSLL
jgi:hypothetical protein